MTEQLPDDHPVLRTLAAVRGELKDSNAKLSKAETELAKFQGIDPAKYREMESAVSGHEKAIQEKEGLIQATNQKLQGLTKKTALAAALSDPTVKGKAGVVDLLFPHVEKDLAVGDDGSIMVVGKDGKAKLSKDSKPVSLTEYLISLRTEATGIFFDPLDTGSGGGFKPPLPNQSNQQINTANMTPAQRVAAARANGQIQTPGR